MRQLTACISGTAACLALSAIQNLSRGYCAYCVLCVRAPQHSRVLRTHVNMYVVDVLVDIL